MKTSIFLWALLPLGLAFSAHGKTDARNNAPADFFEPYQTTELRLPAFPIVVNDPYFSIWSPYDQLTENVTSHWTGDPKPLTGLLRVDGEVYRFMGNEPQSMKTLLPTAREKTWEAPYTRTTPAAAWTGLSFDDTAWQRAKGAFGSSRNAFNHTLWDGEGTDLYVRREVNLTADDVDGELFLYYSHDDVFEVFINGVKILDTGNTWKRDQVLKLDGEAKAALRVGRNVVAAHCHNTVGGAELDYGLYRNMLAGKLPMKTAKQKSVSVMATSTYYTLSCGPVDLDLVFTAPMLINDYDLLTTPINYISYQVRPTDGKAHTVQFYMDATQQMGLNEPTQPTLSTYERQRGMDYLKTGTVEQPILAKKGDGICIDWGYFYLPAVNGQISLGRYADMEQHFMKQGTLLPTQHTMRADNTAELVALAYLHDFGTVVQPQQSFAMVGYDEVDDIEYFFKRYKAYWAHNGKVSLMDAFAKLGKDYAHIMKQCRQWDKTIYDDGMQAGGRHYAELLSGTYRHVIAAHKLFEDEKGNLLFFSKENNSNGSVNTVDLTYPSAPLFLCYNPELLKGMMTSILSYAESGRWTKPFAAHDIGTYPLANGQTYGGDMPLEESGNILTLCAMVCQLDGNANYVAPYWDVLTTWTNYLVENGGDPSEQLCTDDFAGHWAHNCNLSIKAIMGILAYSRLAGLRGEADVQKKYELTARKMAQEWEKNAQDGDHYRLAFDRPGTWGIKYNLVWDELWDTHIFSGDVMKKELAFYLKNQNVYGLPLDCRRDYTKSDWIMWVAAMAKDKQTFDQLVDPIYKYACETTSRVALSDWHDTKTGRYEAFIGRSVVGGYWMKVLMDRIRQK